MPLPAQSAARADLAALQKFNKERKRAPTMDPVGSNSQPGGIAHPRKGHPRQLAFYTE